MENNENFGGEEEEDVEENEEENAECGNDKESTVLCRSKCMNYRGKFY